MINILSDFQTGGYEVITVNTAVGFTSTEIRPTSGFFKGMTCQAVFCTLETDDIRFTLDGTTPSSTVGHLLKSGESLTIANANDIANFKCIKVTTNASLKVTYKF
ncbi:MAG: hypothetical protein U9O65_03910 [Thermotogota bacterium]|nr:hypothetical protein [Thermotogota bacterium]